MSTETSDAEKVSLPPFLLADLNWSSRMVTTEPAGMTTRPSAEDTASPTVAVMVAPDCVCRELTESLALAGKVVPAASDAAGLGAGFGAAGFGFGAAAVGVGAAAGGVWAGVAAVSLIGMVESGLVK